jgi:hypothetical protein
VGPRWIAALTFAGGAAASACGGAKTATEAADASLDGSVAAHDATAPSPELDAQLTFAGNCDAGWSCLVDTDCGSTPTTLTGKVFDPAGTTPLYNAVVFVPESQDLPAITPGSPSCTTMTLGRYVAAAATDDRGAFKLYGVPAAKQVPVVVQTGKWRRTVYVDIPNDCATNAVADGTLRLPRKRSEGDMPQMALLTGGEDNLGCLLVRVGVDSSELSTPGTGGRVDVYRGVGGAGVSFDVGTQVTPVAEGDCTGASCPLWASSASLAAYDVLLLGCEGAANLQTKPASSIQAMHDWLVSGGKLFGVHAQDVWLASGPPDLQSLATWIDGGAWGAPGPFLVDTAFPNGQIFENWGEGVSVVDAGGALPLASGDVATSVAAAQAPAVAWIYDESTATDASPGTVKALSATIKPPIDAGEVAACGKVVLTDIHPGGTVPVSPLPGACPTGPLGAEEKVLEYLLFYAMQPPPVTPPCGCPPPPPPPPPDDAGN